jgi:type IV pilus assembly protein PilC
MPLYNYVAINSAGKTINVSYEAKSREDVVEKIKRENLYLVEIKEIKAHDIKMPFSLGKIKTMDIALFCRQTATLLNAGIPLADCLEIISNQMTNKRLKLIITEISSDVQKGLPLSDAMKKQNVFPEILVNMVAAGEVSGTVDTVMTRMANSYEKDCAIQRRIKGAMVYPLILAIVAIAAVVYITTSVLPKFVEMFESGGIEMPAITKLLISISGFLISYWYLLLGCLVGIVIGVMYFLRTEFGRNLFDLLKLRIPLVSKLNIKIISVRFTRMMGSLLASGIPLIQAFEYLSIVVDNEIVKEKVLKARDDIGKGSELTEAISRMGVFEPMLINMVKIGEESGKLDAIMDNTAEIYDDEVTTVIQSLTTLVEPVMIVFMAGIIGFIVISMVSPMFDMTSTIGM